MPALSIVYRRSEDHQNAVIGHGNTADATTAINVGTIHYSLRQFSQAEQFYRCATEADPEHPLAFYNLGNALDELRRLPEAIAAYERAIHLAPQYADAHYNLAIALQRQGECRAALVHWREYSRLDPTGSSHDHAKMQVRTILAADRLKVCPAPRKDSQQLTFF